MAAPMMYTTKKPNPTIKSLFLVWVYWFFWGSDPPPSPTNYFCFRFCPTTAPGSLTYLTGNNTTHYLYSQNTAVTAIITFIALTLFGSMLSYRMQTTQTIDV